MAVSRTEDFGDNIDDTKVVNVLMHANGRVNSDYEAREPALPGWSRQGPPGASDTWDMKDVDCFQEQHMDASRGRGGQELDRAVLDSPEGRRDRRAEYLQVCTDYQIQDYVQEPAPGPDTQPGGVDPDEVNFMQRGTPPRDGWFNKAMREFRWLRSRNCHATAARLLRDKLRRVRNPKIHQAAQAHLRDIFDDEGSEVLPGSETTEEAWAESVFKGLERLARTSDTRDEGETDAGFMCDIMPEGREEGSGSAASTSLPFGMMHARHVWQNGTWSSREELIAMERHDLLLAESPVEGDTDAEHEGAPCLDAQPAAEAEAEMAADRGPDVPMDASDEAPSNQELETTWSNLMEQLWRWFEAGLATDHAIAMLRQRVLDRRNLDYSEWAEGPERTVAAGIAEGSWSLRETTPPMFYRWSQRVEEILYGLYRERLPQAAGGATATDEVSMMDRTSHHRRRRTRLRSRSPGRGGGLRRYSERVTTEVRHLVGGRASGSGSSRLDGGSEAAYRRGEPGPSSRPTCRGGREVRDHAGELSREPGTSSGSGGPRTFHSDEVRVVNEASGIPDLDQPLTLDQGVNLWRYLLFDRNSFSPDRPRIPVTWLPQDTLTNISVHMEHMSEFNMQIMTVALLTMIRYLMAEISQTMSMAQAIRRTRLGLEEGIDLAEEEEEGREEGDGSGFMQTFFQSGGHDTPQRRWARALLRLHKELEGQPKPMRVRSVAALRAAMPECMMDLEAVGYQSQLQALLVAVQDDSQGTQGTVETPPQWLETWIQEISAFIPGYRQVQPAQTLVDSLPEANLDELLQDEAEQRDYLLACQAQADEEDEARRLAEQAQEALCSQEQRHLEAEAAEYKAWERSVEAGALKRSGSPVDARPGKRCVLTVELATGSSDAPRVVRTVGLDLPLDGTPVTIQMRAEMETVPSEVSTIPVIPPSCPANPREAPELMGDVGLGDDGDNAPPTGPVAVPLMLQESESRETEQTLELPGGSKACDNAPGLLQLLDYRDYEVLYDRWHRGELNQREVLLYYGAEVLELMLAQEAVAEVADQEGAAGPVPAGSDDSATIRGMQSNDKGEWVRIGFGQFEVVYGRWKLKEISDEEVAGSYGDDWVRLFRQWRVWGLQAIWHLLPRLLDVLPDTGAARRGVGFHLLRPEPLPPVLRIPYFVIKGYYEEWLQGDLTDARVVERFGALWLVWFRRLRDEGVQQVKQELSQHVFWEEEGRN